MRCAINLLPAGHRRDWEDLGRLDPYWAILSAPAQRGSGWDLAEFLRTGEAEMAAVMAIADRHALPQLRRRALDFGCGVGRVTRPMSLLFEDCHGADISTSMLARARELNADRPNCVFEPVMTDGGLRYDDAYFDFIYCSRVLQHLPDVRAIAASIAELLRVLAPGGLLVFQLPSHIPPRRRLQPRRRVYSLLRWLRVPPDVLIRSRRLSPMGMLGMTGDEVSSLLRANGGELLEVVASSIPGTGIEEGTYAVTKGGVRVETERFAAG